ncbi:hypothetical protein MTO96_047146 [Rhipicephalus appendiculatus]
MPTVPAPTRHRARRKRKKSESKSSSSGRSKSSRGSDTSPPAASSSSTRANLPELFALLGMQQEADQDERQRNDSEDCCVPASRWTSDDDFGEKAK